MNSADRDSQGIREFRKQRILKADAYRKENFRDTFPLLNIAIVIDLQSPSFSPIPLPLHILLQLHIPLSFILL